MHRQRTLIAAALLALSGTSHAEDAEGEEPTASPLTVGASFFSRYEVRDNYAALGRIGRRVGEHDGVAYRARLSLGTAPRTIAPGKTVALRFVPQASGFWGDVSGGLADAALGLHEGALRYATGDFWVDVGRFEMAYGEHLVIGNVGWHETGRSFDGVRTRLSLDAAGAFWDVFATQVAEGGLTGATSPVGAGDVYFAGSYLGLGPLLSSNLELDAYGFVQIAPRTDDGAMPRGRTAVEATLGTRAVKTLGGLVARVETGVQVGRRPVTNASVFAFQVDGDLLARVGSHVRIGAGGAFASGDDPTTTKDEEWNQLYPTAHKFLGLMDIVGGRSNVAAATGKLRVSLDSVSVAADVHAFWRPESPGTEPYAGSEIDAWLLFPVGSGLNLRGQYSLFAPSAPGPFGTDTLAHYVELELRYTL